LIMSVFLQPQTLFSGPGQAFVSILTISYRKSQHQRQNAACPQKARTQEA
jgi:hypothetical protein